MGKKAPVLTLWKRLMEEASKPPEEQEYWDVIAEFGKATDGKKEPPTLGGFLGKVVAQKSMGEWNQLIMEISVNPAEPRHAMVRGTFYTRREIIVDGRQRTGFMLFIYNCLLTKMFDNNCAVIMNAIVMHPGRIIAYNVQEEES
jgi:hypothetical protein